MKLQLLVPALALLAAGPAAAAADDVGAADGACPDGSAKVWVTGSAIKRCVKVLGNGSLDTPSPVYVIGRRDIERSGRSSVGEVLKSYPPLR